MISLSQDLSSTLSEYVKKKKRYLRIFQKLCTFPSAEIYLHYRNFYLHINHNMYYIMYMNMRSGFFKIPLITGIRASLKINCCMGYSLRMCISCLVKKNVTASDNKEEMGFLCYLLLFSIPAIVHCASMILFICLISALFCVWTVNYSQFKNLLGCIFFVGFNSYWILIFNFCKHFSTVLR